jgi:tRNA uridine 5-carboxymethylaminomethyl modification enzyme
MYTYKIKYEVIVVGAGHAGIEAALASSRMGCKTLLLTDNVDSIGQMSCNPAIGGSAKGHLVREIDALGGEMGKAADSSGIQFKILNRKSGPSIWSPRAQCDKKKYQQYLKWICEIAPHLDLIQSSTISLVHKNESIIGVKTSLGVQYEGETVILTTGTFLKGLMHVGDQKISGGRMGDTFCNGISASLKELGIEIGKFKTGTPPRLLKKSINFSKTEPQFGDCPPPRFSFWPKNLFHEEHYNLFFNPILEQKADQIACFLTHTSENSAAIIRGNIHKSAMYSGQISGIGPRYCPSIEDKIMRFKDKEKHQVFLEPEGLLTNEIYVNGLSTSLPIDVQIGLINSIPGCEEATLLRPAYAVEYDFANPEQLTPWLESKKCKNLFLAGQINGTSGYEEAAAQGIMAGINAALRIKKQSPLVLTRDQAYIGVLIDDLITKGVSEPYRIFTSRAEHRLSIRQDNADIRLSHIGRQIGLLSQSQIELVNKKINLINSEINRLKNSTIQNRNLAKWLSTPGVSYDDIPNADLALSWEIKQQIEIQVKYEGYIKRQELEAKKATELEHKQIPPNFDYFLVSNICTEARQKLSQIRPHTIGQASRISGVSPADITALLINLKRGNTK